MAIKGLTDREAAFPKIAILRKGAKKPDGKPGKDLSYFRFDSADQKAIADFAAAYGEQPTEINITLPYPTTDEVFMTAIESYSASGLRSRCDGETISAIREGNTVQRQFIAPRPCPGKEFCKECKPVGRLQFIVPELQRFAYVVAETHSVHDISNLHQQLRAIEGTFGRLNGIPLVLRRSPKSISVPNARGDGRMRVEKHLLSIEINPLWAERQLKAANEHAMESAKIYHQLGGVGMGSAIAQLPAAPTEKRVIQTQTQVADYRSKDEWLWLEQQVSQAIQTQNMGQLDNAIEVGYQMISSRILPPNARDGLEREEQRGREAIANLTTIPTPPLITPKQRKTLNDLRVDRGMDDESFAVLCKSMGAIDPATGEASTKFITQTMLPGLISAIENFTPIAAEPDSIEVEQEQEF